MDIDVPERYHVPHTGGVGQRNVSSAIFDAWSRWLAKRVKTSSEASKLQGGWHCVPRQLSITRGAFSAAVMD